MTSTREIVTTQHFSRRGLGFLWARRNELDPAQVSILESLYNNRKKGSIKGHQTITYKLSKSKAGQLGYGRLYGQKGSLETLEKECRGTLCREFYYDIDIVNCHPVILLQFAKHKYDKELIEVEHYIQNRDMFLSQVSANREDAKKEIIRIFYGGKNKLPILEPLAQEVRSFTKILFQQEQYRDLLNAVKHEDNLYGTFLSYILQTEERACMLSMKEYFESIGFSVDVLCYDGIMIRKGESVIVNDNILRNCEQYITNTCGYNVSVLVKPFESFDIDDEGEVAPKVPKTQYLEKKALFEQQYFYYTERNAIAEIQNDGSLKFYTLTHAEVYLNTWDFIHSGFTDRTSFLNLWLKDPTRRTVKYITMKPSTDPLTYVQQIKMKYLETECPEQTSLYLELWNKLITAVSGNDAVKKEYLEKWLAHLIQKPAENPLTAVIVTGDKGVGKDTLFDFFALYVLGKSYYQNYTTTTQFWDKYDTGRMNKLFAKLEEAVGSLNRDNDAAFKARITAHDQTFNPKGIGAITCDNFIRYVLTTNDSNPVKIEDKDRRYVMFAASNEYQGNHAFWKELRNVLITAEGGAVIGRYLAEMNIRDYNPRELPEDEYKDMIAAAEKSSEQLFIEQWDGAETDATSLYGMYCAFCIENHLPHCPSAKSFGMKLLIFIRDKKIFKKRHMSQGMIYSKSAGS